MRYRLMATYRGSPFEAGIGPTDGDIVLFAACPPPEDLGFEPATGHWRKQLPISEVQAVWESRPVGTFRGERCMVLDDLGDRLHIGYLGHDGYQAEQLGYWQVDRGVFELVAARSEVSDIIEERTEYPRHRTAPAGAAAQSAGSPAARSAAGPGTVPAARAAGAGQLLARPARFLPGPGCAGLPAGQLSAGPADWATRPQGLTAGSMWPDPAASVRPATPRLGSPGSGQYGVARSALPPASIRPARS